MDLPYDQRLALAAERERIRREARRLIDTEERGQTSHTPSLQTLRERLTAPLAPTSYRIEGRQPCGSRVMLAAQFKAGKTTLTGNLIRSLIDGDLFLGRDAVSPIAGRAVVLDFEMSESQLVSWLADQKIRDDDRVIAVALRGRAVAFDILNVDIRARWAQRLRGVACTYLVWDCVRPLMDALGLDEHGDAGRLLVAFDALLAEAGIPDALVVHQMGHTGERSRAIRAFATGLMRNGDSFARMMIPPLPDS